MPALTEDTLLELLDDLGLPIVGPVVDGVGMDGGHVVRASIDSPRLAAVRAVGYRLAPSGRHRVIIWPPTGDPDVQVPRT